MLPHVPASPWLPNHSGPSDSPLSALQQCKLSGPPTAKATAVATVLSNLALCGYMAHAIHGEDCPVEASSKRVSFCVSVWVRCQAQFLHQPSSTAASILRPARWPDRESS
ncbi:hypothetical protein NDU88_005860 [Pleurodeles waltl]|uniref:Uncharacterized protein n=1 Tax=Pleurodeles waltl TaxID=8319 RepID=A0AAV7VL65_PLEWA|nr:hypothetical protein NDU88_005860 [Pleurodeles waltl]